MLVLDREGPTEVTSPLSNVPDLRVSTVTPASVQLLQSVGAWEDIAPPRSAAFQHMQETRLTSPEMNLTMMICDNISTE